MEDSWADQISTSGSEDNSPMCGIHAVAETSTGYPGVTPNRRYSSSNSTERFHQGRNGVTGVPYSYEHPPPARDDYSSYPYWPSHSYQGHIPPHPTLQLQTTLDKILQQQDEIKAGLDDIKSRVADLEASKSVASFNRTPAEKRKIANELSKLIGHLHENLDDGDQFLPHMKLSDEHNKAVKKRIREEILLKKEDSYTLTETNGAIKTSIRTFYESRRRIWRESLEEGSERIRKQNKSRKLRSRKVRLFDRRRKVIRPGKETERFNQLTLYYMSDEDSDEESDIITVHRPLWRSTILTTFLEELDKRVTEQQSQSKKFIPERKVRVVGDCVNSSPPSNAPKWTIDNAWLQDHPEYKVTEAS